MRANAQQSAAGKARRKRWSLTDDTHATPTAAVTAALQRIHELGVLRELWASFLCSRIHPNSIALRAFAPACGRATVHPLVQHSRFILREQSCSRDGVLTSCRAEQTTTSPLTTSWRRWTPAMLQESATFSSFSLVFSLSVSAQRGTPQIQPYCILDVSSVPPWSSTPDTRPWSKFPFNMLFARTRLWPLVPCKGGNCAPSHPKGGRSSRAVVQAPQVVRVPARSFRSFARKARSARQQCRPSRRRQRRRRHYRGRRSAVLRRCSAAWGRLQGVERMRWRGGCRRRGGWEAQIWYELDSCACLPPDLMIHISL